ncbi:hypothetical protein DFH08DRAFT_807452 [Mycena albidolilacea]|uniref:Uncharacterized protein n=1 Tax=Mycena albidolilacea TaxID=1033008 RepID=A0AAD7ETE0_9AGAR|nr:hypothetical protein DFH08DRAFT_807452 [Mycena albidolilacea]
MAVSISTAILFLFLSSISCVAPVRRTIVRRTTACIHNLLPSTNIHLHSHASPNARLVRAFHPTDIFVSTNPNGSVVLRTIIIGLPYPCADITPLAPNITTAEIQHLLEELNHYLRDLVPDQTAYPNLSNFGIPTWETLCRVVAVTLAYTHTNVVASAHNINQFVRLHPLVRPITQHNFRHSLLTTLIPRSLAPRIPPHIDPHPADIESAQRSVLWELDSLPPEAYNAARFVREPTVWDVLAFRANLNPIDVVTYIFRWQRGGAQTESNGRVVRQLA